ncbi:MAG: hypothetical protein QOA06_06495, partial [Nitrososphaeraceae archaeon]|nr:hypothetical protein [Nitrososphaeraceae archaeon]
ITLMICLLSTLICSKVTIPVELLPKEGSIPTLFSVYNETGILSVSYCWLSLYSSVSVTDLEGCLPYQDKDHSIPFEIQVHSFSS